MTLRDYIARLLTTRYYSFFRESKQQIIRFVVVGICGVSIDAIVYTLLFWLGVSLSLAKLAGVLCSFTWGLCMNTLWVFSSMADIPTIVRYGILNIVSIGAHVALNAMLIVVTGGTPVGMFFAFFCCTAQSMIVNFLGMKIWVYKK